MAAGWPKNDIDEDGNEVVKEGSRPARLLHMVRRAERNLMSYERTGMLLKLPALQHRYVYTADVIARLVCNDNRPNMT